MTYPTDKQLEAAAYAFHGQNWHHFDNRNKMIARRNIRAAIIAADQAAWEPIENAPPGDDIDLIGMFEPPTRRFVAVCWQYKGFWWWFCDNAVYRCDSDPVKFQMMPGVQGEDA